MVSVIVTGVDGSLTAALAAKRAAELAVRLDSELQVVSAYGRFEIDTFSSGEEQIVFSTAKDAARIAADSVALLRSEFPGLVVRSEPPRANRATRLSRLLSGCMPTSSS